MIHNNLIETRLKDFEAEVKRIVSARLRYEAQLKAEREMNSEEKAGIKIDSETFFKTKLFNKTYL